MGLSTAAAIIGTGLKVGSSLLGGRAAKKAASKQASAISRSLESAIQFQQDIYDRQQRALEPQRIIGEQGQFALADLLGLARPQDSQIAQEIQDRRGGAVPLTGGIQGNALTNALAASPDFQFRLNEGLDAIQSGAASRGLLRSGRSLRDLEGFRQGLASQEFGNRFNRLAAIANMGAGATNQANAFGSQLGQSVSNQMTQGGRDLGAVRASGIMGQGQGFANALGALGQGVGAFAGGFGGGGFKLGGSPTQFASRNFGAMVGL